MPLPRFLTMPRPPLARLAPLALFRQTLPSDLDHLVALRITAMRPSLEQIGRFDPLFECPRALARRDERTRDDR